MTKDRILAEIRRTAAENGGVALGIIRFQTTTGISASTWGKFWRKWSEAVREAGLAPRKKTEPTDRNVLVLHLLELARMLGRFPTYTDLRFERRTNVALPNPGTFNRLGNQGERIALIRAYATGHPEFADVLTVLPEANVDAVADATPDETFTGGSVYLVKHGRHYKVGKSYDVPRRHRQIDLELPEKLVPIHSMRTDDPSGIETYWHTRFASKRLKGEWFDLTAADVRAFKRRKFM